MAEIDHEFTREIVCPYCGYVHSESYDFGNGGEEDSETECGRCDRKFNWSRMISVSYSTSKIKEENAEQTEPEAMFVPTFWIADEQPQTLAEAIEEDDHRDDAWCLPPDMGAQ
ncbi:MAG: hypothetical protein WC919_01120 [Candidatus Paceibacterota bacterium]|jgi:hypothetical protein